MEKRDFRARRDGSHYLRLRSQATVNGRGRVPLKHREEGQGRDIPVPDYVWNMVRAMPAGPLCPGPRGTPYLPYFTARGRFDALTAAMGITGYTTHSLRHQFASEALDRGANIANIAAILGHRTVETTLRIYTRTRTSGQRAAQCAAAARPGPPGPRRHGPAPRPPRKRQAAGRRPARTPPRGNGASALHSPASPQDQHASSRPGRRRPAEGRASRKAQPATRRDCKPVSSSHPRARTAPPPTPPHQR
jgi:hypothetical protein